MDIKTYMLIQRTKENIYQLLSIGLHNTDENIKEVYGGEAGLLNLIRGYFCLLEDLQAFRYREIAENKELGSRKE